MSPLWIVHRDPQRRMALTRAASAPLSAISGGPGDPLFDSAPPARVVLMGLAGDLEAELEFAHRVSRRFPDARWVLVAEPVDASVVAQLFDTIDAEILTFPPDPRALRSSLHGQTRGAAKRPLSMRPARDALAERFSRWFAHLDLPELLLALDPQLADTPLLIFGEDGTGRGMLARYVHEFSRDRVGVFAQVACGESMTGEGLLVAIRDAAGLLGASAAATIWLDQVDVLPRATQRQLARWIEFGLPDTAVRCHVDRWIATSDDEVEPGWRPDLQSGLRDALGGVSIRLPSVRERTHLIAAFANDTALAWCADHRQSPRRLGEDAIAVLEEYPWSGNLRELEAVVRQTLAAGAMDPIRADDLQYDGTAFAPIDAAEVGVLLDSDESDAVGDWNPIDEFDPIPRARSESPPLSRHTALHSSQDPSQDPSHNQPQTPSEPPPVAAPKDSQVREEPEPARTFEGGANLQRLVGAIAHEIRNPLSTIRTFTELLPNRFDDPDFRDTFAELVGQDALRLEQVVSGLSGLASLSNPEPVRVDISAIVEELLEQRRTRVHERKLLVLKELASERAAAMVDEAQIRFALDSVLEKTIELAPERGDVYVSTRRSTGGLGGAAAVRVLIRFGNRAGLSEPTPSARAPRIPGVSPAENALSFAIAEAIVQRLGGAFTINLGDDDETVIWVDLPAATD